ncbi:hypothetical protein TrLO_g13134 [Triparma laevis f. longispina]|uniref:PH domain-containing protein n=1 Tax=Triparma laevis f. longispina TaxID=1714387 RepID=A0A9W7CIE5_9STRA|nr:hypothetical protein TrLO_g13134 [Triparma laevis f. longispina]
MNHLSLHVSDDEGTVDSATPSIIKSIRDRPIDFDVASSQLICSGFMSKKARGRRMVGKLFDNTRMRWFELRCDGSVLPTYCLLYYKAKDDKKPKGTIYLSPFDSILQSEDNLCEITLQCEHDTETKHQMLMMIAEDENCANAWIESFQQAIVTLNRLTVITEGDDEDRPTSTRPGGRVSLMDNGMIVAHKDKDKMDDVNWGKKNSQVISSEHLSLSSESPQQQILRKRDIIKGMITGDKRISTLAGGMVGKKLKDFLDWPKVTGNGGNATSGKALMFAMANEFVASDESSSDYDTDGHEVIDPKLPHPNPSHKQGSLLLITHEDSPNEFGDALRNNPSPVKEIGNVNLEKDVVDLSLNSPVRSGGSVRELFQSTSSLTISRTRTMTAASLGLPPAPVAPVAPGGVSPGLTSSGSGVGGSDRSFSIERTRTMTAASLGMGAPPPPPPPPGNV